ncbi:hypothetical protein SUGI_0339230 [Cryptomeria japonica]|nr:abscisic acid and environmental stress-inducible protein TAS14 [Cryptomeria japonica]GLJ18970.1 hypothetical protein SUGI_0339210 [Cryptomeria japonica]GLJ18972.1 hypothetical protein SUGI_0339230 [Cryptomeria japonica]
MADSNAPEQQDRGLFGKNKDEKTAQQQQHGECGIGEKKGGGLVDKIKENLPGQKKEGQVIHEDKQEKQGGGMMDKVKEKFPGQKKEGL